MTKPMMMLLLLVMMPMMATPLQARCSAGGHCEEMCVCVSVCVSE